MRIPIVRIATDAGLSGCGQGKPCVKPSIRDVVPERTAACLAAEDRAFFA
jgi:hypothetical protein